MADIGRLLKKRGSKRDVKTRKTGVKKFAAELP